jgi:hypothetical protein
VAVAVAVAVAVGVAPVPVPVQVRLTVPVFVLWPSALKVNVSAPVTAPGPVGWHST